MQEEGGDLPEEGGDLPKEGGDLVEEPELQEEGGDLPEEGRDLPEEGAELPEEGSGGAVLAQTGDRVRELLLLHVSEMPFPCSSSSVQSDIYNE